MTTWHSTSDVARELTARPSRTHCAPRPQHVDIYGVDLWQANEGAPAARPGPNCAAIVAPRRRYVYDDSSRLQGRQRRALVKLTGNLPARTSIAPAGGNYRN